MFFVDNDNGFWGDLTNISSKKEALNQSLQLFGKAVVASVAVVAEISIRSPRKLLILLSKNVVIGSKYPTTNLSNFEKKLHWWQRPQSSTRE